MARTKPTIQNRGTSDTPFGYVYIDETRVGFSTADDDRTKVKMWETRGYPVSMDQLRRAARALIEAGLEVE